MWCSDEELSHWFMVEADDDGNVLELFLSRNNLSGEFVMLLLTSDDGQRVIADSASRNRLQKALSQWLMVKANDDGNVLELFFSKNNLSGEFVMMLPTSDDRQRVIADNMPRNRFQKPAYV